MSKEKEIVLKDGDHTAKASFVQVPTVFGEATRLHIDVYHGDERIKHSTKSTSGYTPKDWESKSFRKYVQELMKLQLDIYEGKKVDFNTRMEEIEKLGKSQ